MKFRIGLEAPGSINVDVEDSTNNKDEEREVFALCEQWFRDRETLTIEIDTEAKTCTVVEVGK